MQVADIPLPRLENLSRNQRFGCEQSAAVFHSVNGKSIRMDDADGTPPQRRVVAARSVCPGGLGVPEIRLAQVIIHVRGRSSRWLRPVRFGASDGKEDK
jgi:hypothetical protein